MELAPVSDLLDTASGAGTAAAGMAAGGVVHVEVVDVAALCDEGLSLRLGVLGRAESRLAAMKAQVLAEASRRHSSTDAQRIVRDELQASKREAKRDVESAIRLAQLPVTSEALASGEIPQGHARLIARASSETPIDETVLVKAANTQPFDEFARTVKRHQQDVAVDDGQGLLDRQRKNRKARIFESADSGMFVLSGEFDQITGARIATALTAKERQLWHREDPNTRATPQQRMADALAELICEPAGDGKSAGTDLLVIADFDVIKQQLDNPRLADGSAIPIVELHRLALEANLLPSIFDTKAQDMWLGRKQRTASEAQRVALIARDQHCIGCSANPLWCRAHHIIWWSKNGPTDVDNLVLVCDDCHHKIHDHGWQVYKHPETGKYHLKPPNPTKTTKTTQPVIRAQPGPRKPDPATQPGPSNPTRTEQPRPRKPDPATQPGPSNPDRANRTQQPNPDRATQTAQTGPSNPDRTQQPRPRKPDPATQPGPSNPDRANRTQQPRPDPATQTAQTGPSNPTRTQQPRPRKPDPATQPGPSNPDRANRTQQARPDRATQTAQTAQGSSMRTAPDRTEQPRPRKPDRVRRSGVNAAGHSQADLLRQKPQPVKPTQQSITRPTSRGETGADQ